MGKPCGYSGGSDKKELDFYGPNCTVERLINSFTSLRRHAVYYSGYPL